MNLKPLVSVITIVWNDAEGFLVTANSVLRQTYKNIEWIVIDGNSTDGTSEYVRKLSPVISRFVIEEDTGIYNAMNKGIEIANGEWCVFMNADDAFYNENVISEYVEKATNEDDVLYSDVMRREDNVIPPYRPDKYYYLGMVFDHQSAFVRTELYKKFKYDETFKVSGDLNFFSNLRSKKYNFRKLDGMISSIKPFDVGASSIYFKRQCERIKVLKSYFYSDELIQSLVKEFDGALQNNDVNREQYKLLISYLGN